MEEGKQRTVRPLNLEQACMMWSSRSRNTASRSSSARRSILCSSTKTLASGECESSASATSLKRPMSMSTEMSNTYTRSSTELKMRSRIEFR